MSSDLKANNLKVKSFRGIYSEISLNLEDFTIIYGENGTGKSSFVNSLQYLFEKKLAFLSRQGVKKTAYVNENSNKKDIRIELNFDDDEYISLKGTRKSNSSYFDDILSNPFLKNASFVVDRAKLLDFVNGAPGGRYKAMMRFLNIKKFDSVQDVLSPAVRELKSKVSYKESSQDNDLKRLIELKDSRDSALKLINDMESFRDSILKDIEINKKQNEEDIEKLNKLNTEKEAACQKSIDEINDLLKMKNLGLIEFNTDLEKYKRDLLSSPIFNMDTKILEFQKNYENLDFDIENRLSDILKQYELIASDNLKSSQFLIKSLETTMNYIDLTNTDICPICNSNIDSELIIKEISDKISQINASNDIYKKWKSNLNGLISYLDSELRNYDKLNDSIADINELITKDIESIDLSILHNLKTDLIDLSEFKKYPSDFNHDFNAFYNQVKFAKFTVENVKMNEDKADYEKIIDKLTDLNIFKCSDIDKDSLEKQINQRKINIENKIRDLKNRENEDATLKDKIIQYEKGIEELEKDIANYDSDLQKIKEQYRIAEKILDVFTRTKEEYIDNMLSDIRDDIKYYYDFIHGDDQIKSPDVVVSGAKKIDVKLNSFGEYLDSRSFASEGHLDTLGFCIFLAFNKHFNNLGLIVLDDVLTTVDIYHKERIARLLAEEFDDYQFLITTHDKGWINQLEELCVDYDINNVIYEIEDWSLEDGPTIYQK